MSNDKTIVAKYSSVCCECGLKISKGANVLYNSEIKKIRCLTHTIENSYGKAGKSAREKSNKIEAKRKERIESIPFIGKMLYPILDPSIEAQMWEKGAKGEEKIGKILDDLATQNGFVSIHDRKIPNSKANIDHMLVTPKGVFVIDAKNYTGMVELRKKGNWFLPGNDILYVNGRNQHKLVSLLAWQVGVVKENLQSDSTDVVGILAFTQGDWPWVGKPKVVEGVYLNSRGISNVINSYKSTDYTDVDQIARKILNVFKAK